jgi:hypothetical protein
MTAKIMDIKNHTKRTTVSDYMVPVMQPFTKEHLVVNKRFINPERTPELLTDIEHMGLTYKDTELKEIFELDKARTHGLLQKFRRGRNPEYSNIQKDVTGNGKDIRERPVLVVEDENGEIEIIIEGNTIDDIYHKHGSPNEIVCTFTKNSNYTEANLIACGGYFNSLGHAKGVNDLANLEFLIAQIVVSDPKLNLKKNETRSNVIAEFTNKIKNYLKFMAGNLNVETKEFNRIINNLVTEQTGIEQAANPTAKLVLEDMRNNGYKDNNYIKYTAYGSFISKMVGEHWKKEDIPVGKYKQIATAIHLSAPDLSDPINSWIDAAIKHNRDYVEWNEWITERNDGKDPYKSFGILGYYQSVLALDDVWPYKSIISIEDIKTYRAKNPA